jgi:hypothetical protein
MKTTAQLYKDAISNEFAKLKGGSELMKVANSYKSNLKETEKPKKNKTFDEIVKKNLKKGENISVVEKKLKSEIIKGIKVEMEHTNNKEIAKKIAMDHLYEDLNYYKKLKKIETKEATGSGSAGQYSGPVFGGNDEFWEKSRSETPKLKEDIEKVETKEATGSGSVGSYSTPAMWAKSTKKKDWGPSRKTQLPGGTFVSVKKKCKKFPYCNQGDIKALNLYENDNLKNAIKNISKKYNISETTIKSILNYELEKIDKIK